MLPIKEHAVTELGMQDINMLFQATQSGNAFHIMSCKMAGKCCTMHMIRYSNAKKIALIYAGYITSVIH